MTPDMQQAIEAVKTAKATALYWDDVKRYGSEGHALRALDCRSRTEAIKMLSVVQNVSIFTHSGKVVVR